LHSIGVGRLLAAEGGGVSAMAVMIGVLCVLAIAYRFYSKFIAVRVVGLDASRATPATTQGDGQNYFPTNRWVLFGHHFAAISGAGPLIGPVIAAQYGYAPGLLWILIGVTLAGAVQDFIVLALSTRRGGKSLATLAVTEIGATSGAAATIGILFVLVVALAGLGVVVVKALGGETITYEPGTTFNIPQAGSIYAVDRHDVALTYQIPQGALIRFPNGETSSVGTPFDVETRPLDYNAGLTYLDTGAVPGEQITIPKGFTATRRVAGSSWGTFTLTMTIPIALLVGWWMYRARKGKVLEASIIGGVLTLLAVYAGSRIPGGPFEKMFDLTGFQVGMAMAIYGFIASVLPVWILLCPRDYLSSFLKIGTIALLVIGVIIANPHLHAPAYNTAFAAGGPVLPQPIFPFVFITIMCGAISGFHSLVSSGTTPKMIAKETDARLIGYGAMLMEGLVGIVALIAACSLPNSYYYAMNTSWKNLPKYQQQIVAIEQANQHGDPAPQPLSVVEHQVGETLQGRTGGAVTLAVGMSEIFDGAAKRLLSGSWVEHVEEMIPYWYHFAIMFEALFILTTIDTGTRIGRFLLQEIFGRINPKLGRPDWWPGAIAATALMVCGWWYFLSTNSVETIWPMFGVSNQLLAVIALMVATTALVRSGKGRFAWVTAVPLVFVSITTTTAGVMMIRGFAAKLGVAGIDHLAPALNITLLVVILLCTALVVIGGLGRIMALERTPVGQRGGVF
jgi:carbon starvation protein